MPSWLIATKKDANGKVVDRQVMPFEDRGADSIPAAQEEKRLQALGYETRIERSPHKIEREGGEILR